MNLRTNLLTEMILNHTDNKVKEEDIEINVKEDKIAC